MSDQDWILLKEELLEQNKKVLLKLKKDSVKESIPEEYMIARFVNINGCKKGFYDMNYKLINYEVESWEYLSAKYLKEKKVNNER